MTEKQVLKLTGVEFSKFAGEVLQSEIKEHRAYTRKCKDARVPIGCVHCDANYIRKGIHWKTPKETCVCRPIPLTPDNAFKWRDWAVEKFTRDMFARILWEVYYSTESYGKISFTDWICSVAQPIHYIKAAVLCEMRTK